MENFSDQDSNMLENTALAPFDISQYRGVRGQNFFGEDTILVQLLDRFSPTYSKEHKKDMFEHVARYGELAGGIIDELTEASHKEGKYGEVVSYDRSGNQIEEIRYCLEQRESRRISYEHGIVNLDFLPDWKHPFTWLHRTALTYICNMNGEGGVACPLAMTEGMIRVIRALGTDEQKELYLPLIAGPESHSHFMCGQYVTERTGGSNVAMNRTVARKRPDGKWLLTGEKWFCSNPGDLWVTTARVEGTNTIGLFLVPRLTEEGDVNGFRILRKKDIIGSKGKLTVEVAYDDVIAEELGRPAHGLANIIKYVIRTSRLHVALGGIGMGRRACMEAKAYTHVREAYGKKIVEIPVVLRSLSEMLVIQAAMEVAVFQNHYFVDGDENSSQVLTPLLKYTASTLSTWLSKEAMQLHGGQGIVNDFSILPRLHNDSIINETWEGNHSLLQEHTIKAWNRKKCREDLLTYVKKQFIHLTVDQIAFIEEQITFVMHADQDLERQQICDALFNLFSLAAFAEHTFWRKDITLQTMLAGYTEILRRGKLGVLEKDSVFRDLEAMRSIVAY